MPNNEIVMSELTSAIWAMEPRRLTAFLAGVADYKAFTGITKEANSEPVASTVSGGVAIIPINGILMNTVPRWFSFFDIEATSYRDIISMVDAAVQSDDVEQIRLAVNSPGGKVEGSHEAAEAIFNAGKTKPVSAYISHIGASGAYLLASQAKTIVAGPNAEIGALGVFALFVDSSKAAEDEGIKVHIVRSGDHKGMGMPGVEITKEQLASQQAVVDGMADNFIKAVARGRGMNIREVQKLATGETWIAKTAKQNGLIDSVVGVAKNNDSSNEKGSIMETPEKKVEEPKVDIEKIQAEAGKEAVAKDRERLSAMQTEFDDDLEFAVEQFTKGATLIEAKAAYSDVLKERLADVKKNPPKQAPEKGKVGAKAIEHSEGGEEGADDFLTQAKAMAKELGIKTSEAIKKLKQDDPDLFARSQNR